MKNRGLGLLVAMMVTALFVFIFFSDRLESFEELPPTEFESYEEIGAQIYDILKKDVKKYQIIALGTSPLNRKGVAVWKGFLKAVTEKGGEDFFLFEEAGVSSLNVTPELKVSVISSHEDSILDYKRVLFENKKIIFHTLSPKSQQLLKSSPMKHISEELDLPILSISQHIYAVTESQIGKIKPACKKDLITIHPLVNLTCRSQVVAKRHFKKKINEKDLYAIMEKYSNKDRVLFIHDPNIFLEKK